MLSASAQYSKYDPRAPLVQANPYPYYSYLRTHKPILWHEELEVWIISRHQDVSKMLRSAKLGSNYLISSRNNNGEQNLQVNGELWRVLLFMDGEEHRQIRKAVARSLDAKLMANLKRYIVSTTSKIFDGFKGRAEIEIIDELAAPLPLHVLCHLLGIPKSGLTIIKEHAEAFAKLVDWSPSFESVNNASDEATALTPYLVNLLRYKRRNPQTDLISNLIQQVKYGDINYSDIISTILLILAAGQKTTTHMIGNGLFALLQNRNIFKKCQSGVYSTPCIVDELLRFDSPVQVTPRTTLFDLEIRGQTIPQGDIVLILLGSANRDEEVFENPDTLNPGRTTANMVSFGGGTHFCLGAILAKVIGITVFDAVFDCFPNAKLATQNVEWQPTITQRGLLSLRVIL